MRLRSTTAAIDVVNQHELVVQEPERYQGKWKEFFGNDHPIKIEIGMGMGDFIIENALKYPECNFIGIEKFSAVLLRAVKKLEKLDPIPNLILLRYHAQDLEKVFSPGEITEVYLNFSDPWPKDRWAARRLTHRGYLMMYHRLLIPGGKVQIKTDNDQLFAFTEEEVPNTPYTILNKSYDLHHSPLVEGNIMTEYEKKFSAKGKNINIMVIASKG